MATNTTNFGTDTSCTNGLRTGRYVSGLRLVAEALYRRLRTPRGTLQGGEEEQNYGLDLLDLLGSIVDPNGSAAAALPAQIQAECLKDERVTDVTATVAQVKNGTVVSWTVTIAVTTGAGPFTFVLGVSSVSVDFLGFTSGD